MPEEKTPNKPAENADKQKKKSPETREKANTAAEKKLKKASAQPQPEEPKNEEKPKWTIKPIWVTWGGDDKMNMTSVGPTLTSPDGETSITAGYTNTTERPDPNMNPRSRDGVGISVSTTPQAVVQGVKKLGSGIKNLFKIKK